MEAPAIVGAGSHLGPENAMGHYLLGVASGVAEQHAAKLRAQSEWREAAQLRPNLSKGTEAPGTSASQHADWGEGAPAKLRVHGRISQCVPGESLI